MAATTGTGTLGHRFLAVDNQSPLTTFSLPAQKQGDSPLLGKVPGEVRQMIFQFCGIKPGKVHLYEQQGSIVWYSCNDEDTSRPCLGPSSCHRVKGQINEVLDRAYYRRLDQKTVLPCPPGCDCQPSGFVALVLTCQAVHAETLAFLYHSKTFIIYKGVFATFLNAATPFQQFTLSSPLKRIRNLQLDLGYAKDGSALAIQAKHATLRAVLQVAVNLKGLSVVFNSQFRRTTERPFDKDTIRLLSRFRGLDNFQLVIQNARDSYCYTGGVPVTPEELRFLRAVPYIEQIFAKFVKLRDMADTTGLDEQEKLMLKSDGRFEKGLKQKVKTMLDG